MQLRVWEKATGERPIQLALKGTSPMSMLRDLAAGPDFTGQVLRRARRFFTGFTYRGDVPQY